jgi:hypothetical protein
MKLTRDNRSTRRKTCPSATLSNTNPTWTDPGSNPGLRGEKPATNRLSDGTAFKKVSTTSNVWRSQWLCLRVLYSFIPTVTLRCVAFTQTKHLLMENRK